MSEIPIAAFAIEPGTISESERLDSALTRLIAEDPSLRVRTDAGKGQVIVAGTSERHLRSVAARLTSDFAVESPMDVLRVIYKERFTRSADGEGRFASGGQYAHVKIRLVPGDLGTGCVFRNVTHSESLPMKFIGPTETGVREALAQRSALASGFDDHIDVAIELHDGSYHDLDSSEMSFKIAGGMALENAAAKAGPVLLEPVMRVEVAVPLEHAGDLLADLSRRRGAIQSVENAGEVCVIGARVPLSTILGHEDDFRSRMGARLSIEFDGYEPSTAKPESGDDERLSSVRTPRISPPKLDESSIALPEPDEDD